MMRSAAVQPYEGLGYGGVNFLGYRYDAGISVYLPASDGLETTGLERKPGIHRVDRIAERARPGQVDHVPAGEDMDAPTVIAGERLDPVELAPDRSYRPIGPNVIDINFLRQMARIYQYRTIPQMRNIGGANNVGRSGRGNDDIRVGKSARAVRYFVTVEHRL